MRKKILLFTFFISIFHHDFKIVHPVNIINIKNLSKDKDFSFREGYSRSLELDLVIFGQNFRNVSSHANIRDACSYFKRM